MVTNIYSLSIEKPYTALNLPMGSETNLKVTLQEENARSFADKIEGVKLFIENSHPHVVEASLDKHNSTLNLNALGIGEANIRLYYKEDIFDVIRVKVLSSVLPHSPVQLHVGGQVQFIFADGEIPANTKWETKHSNILSVDPVYGTTVGRKEGVGEVNILNANSVSLGTVVHVKKVDRIEMDLSTKPEYVTIVESNKHYKEEYVILLNVFLEDGLSEVYPEMIIKNKPLIKHNIKLTSETPNSEFATVYIKTMNNRWYAVVKLMPNCGGSTQSRSKTCDNKAITNLPSSLRFTVRATAEIPSSYKYEETFDIPLLSFFYIHHPTRELKLYGDERFKSIPVTSNSNFNVHVEGNSDLISYKIEEKYESNTYDLQFSVPAIVRSDFSDLKVRISNPMTDQSETFLISFYHKAKSEYSHSHTSKPYYPDETKSKPQEYNDSEDSFSTAVSIGIILIMILGIVVFVVYFCCLKSDNVVYELSDSSGLDSSSKDRYAGFRSKASKSTPIRSKMRYHYKE